MAEAVDGNVAALLGKFTCDINGESAQAEAGGGNDGDGGDNGEDFAALSAFFGP